MQNFVLRLLKKDETWTQKLHYYSCILCCFRKVAKYTEKKNKNREKKFSAAAKILCLGGLEFLGLRDKRRGAKGESQNLWGWGRVKKGG